MSSVLADNRRVRAERRGWTLMAVGASLFAAIMGYALLPVGPPALVVSSTGARLLTMKSIALTGNPG
jgi:hypothetical protein